MSPTPRAALAVALVAVSALALGAGGAAVLGLALLGAFAADAVAARRPPRARRDVPVTLARGRPVALGVEVTGAGAGRARVRQAAVPGVDVVPREGDGGLDAELVPLRRGRHTLPAAAVRVRGPLGLAAWDHGAGGDADLRVLPDVPGARRLAQSAHEGRFREPGRRPRGPVGIGTEFELVRDYLPDDDVRFVNWRATARTGRPMTNVFRVEQEREIVVLLDTGRLMTAPVAGATRLDAALDAATAVGYVADDLGDRCGVVAYADTLRRVLPPRRRGGDALVQACFDLEPVPVESDHELAFREVAGRKRALVLVLTDLLDEAAGRTLLSAVPVLARRHALVVASVADPDVTALLDTPPRTPRDVPRAAVAAEVALAQRALTTRLRAAGAQVLEAPPEQLPARCVGAYLRSKARGRV